MRRITLLLLLFTGACLPSAAQQLPQSAYNKQLNRVLVQDIYVRQECTPILYAISFTVTPGVKQLQNIQLLHHGNQLTDTISLLRQLQKIAISPAWFSSRVNNDLSRHYFIQPVVMLPLKEECADTSDQSTALVTFFTKLLETGPQQKRTAVLLPLAEYYYTKAIYERR
ncbi:MAG: hypothetical protein JNM88_21475 [Chitinophagaceae bacterium]|nr:hypothetical protein [Chitinophagaceae bacterium]